MQDIDEPPPADTGRAPLVGLGGLLLLPILHLVVNALVLLFDAIGAFVQSSEAAATARAVGPVIWSPVAHYAFVFAFFALVAAAYAVFCLVQLLRKKKAVPSLMVIFYVLMMGVLCIRYMEVKRIAELTGSPKDLGDEFTFTVRMLIASAIWIPYFLVSQRVKNTFVR
jgi:hypothetical protein